MQRNGYTFCAVNKVLHPPEFPVGVVVDGENAAVQSDSRSFMNYCANSTSSTV